MMTVMILLRRFGCLSVGCILWKMALCLHDGPVCAEILAAAFDAACAAPYGIELFAERLDNGTFIREDAVLEIPFVFIFRT